MPFLKYFAYVGGALLALLLFANWYLPTPDAERERADADRSTIRIHSIHKWPAAVAFDTTQPAIAAPPAVMAAEAPAPTPVAKPVRDAYALATAEPPAATAKPADTAKPVKRHVRRARTARPPAPGYGYVASYDQFGFRNGWASNW